MTQSPNGDAPRDDGVVDFAPEPRSVRFRIGPDVFEGLDDIPAMSAMRFSAQAGELHGAGVLTEKSVDKMVDLLRLLLKPASAQLLIERMDDPERPVGIETFTRIVPWLLEQYGLRPTEPSPESPDGRPSPDGGTSSTESTSGQVSISAASPSTGS